MDQCGFFLQIAGYIVGLGAVTVIDLHGWLGRTSSYWTEATIRTHKVTKPLIWLGMMLVLMGSLVLYRERYTHAIPQLQFIISTILILNGCFLSFWVSPRLLQREKEGRATELLPLLWQRMITASFVISFFGWWGSVLLAIRFVL